MSSSQKATIRLNIAQNSPSFELEPLDKQVLIFKKEFFSKALDPVKENPEKPENYRIVIVK
jgi:hypothetical protein